MNKIDTYILEKFQAFSDWFQDMTGKTCFWLALCIACLKLMINVHSWLIFGWMAYMVVVNLIGFSAIFFAINQMNSVSSGDEFANPLKHLTVFIYLRIGSFGGMVGSVCGIFGQIMKGDPFSKDTYSWISVILVFFIFYLVSCSPQSGGKYKAGKWLDAIARTLFGKLAPQAT